MTVQELIELLVKYPADLRVVADSYEEGYDDLYPELVSVCEIRLDAGTAWWECQHRGAEDTRNEGSAIVKALALRHPWESS